jgi:hypothetical protein
MLMRKGKGVQEHPFVASGRLILGSYPNKSATHKYLCFLIDLFSLNPFKRCRYCLLLGQGYGTGRVCSASK